MTVRFNTAEVDGRTVFYRTAGDPSAPAVLDLHGFPSASHMFRDLFPELAGIYPVVAPDHRLARPRRAGSDLRGRRARTSPDGDRP